MHQTPKKAIGAMMTGCVLCVVAAVLEIVEEVAESDGHGLAVVAGAESEDTLETVADVVVADAAAEDWPETESTAKSELTAAGETEELEAGREVVRAAAAESEGGGGVELVAATRVICGEECRDDLLEDVRVLRDTACADR